MTEETITALWAALDRVHYELAEARNILKEAEEPEAALPEEPPVGTVVIKTDAAGVPLPGASAIVRTEEGWYEGGAHTLYWAEVVELAPLKIIHEPDPGLKVYGAEEVPVEPITETLYSSDARPVQA